MNKQLIEWSDENVSALRRLWKAGESAAFIAERLGCARGRLAVIGKAKRLKLGPHPHAIGKTKAVAEARKRKVRKMAKRMEADGSLSRYKAVGPVRKRKPPKPLVVIEKVKERKASNNGPVLTGDYRYLKSTAWTALEGSQPVKLEDLPKRGACRWPLGDGPFMFCALPTEGLYCETHTYLSHPKT